MSKNPIAPSSSFPLLGIHYSPESYIPLDLTSTYDPSNGVDAMNHLNQILQQCRQQYPGCIPYGGYMERRGIYTSKLFASDDPTPRCIHLGVDLWAKANISIHAPFDGEVHSFRYNPAQLDYGYTIVLMHQVDEATFYTLYGHLSDYNFDTLTSGQHISRGDIFCKLGTKQQNGGWPPHLHFQIIMDMSGHTGDFPGVSTEAEAEKYSHLCPDPTHIALGN